MLFEKIFLYLIFVVNVLMFNYFKTQYLLLTEAAYA